MWTDWTGDLLNLLAVLILWTVLLPNNSDNWRVTLFGRFSMRVRRLQLLGSFVVIELFDVLAEISQINLQPRFFLQLLLFMGVLALFFRGFPVAFTMMHTFFAVTVTEYFKLLFRCFVPWEWNDWLEVLLVNGSVLICVLLIRWIIRRQKLDFQYYEHRIKCWIATAVLGIPVIILAQYIQNSGQQSMGSLPGMFMLLHFLMLCLMVGLAIFYRGRQESQKIAANDRYIQSMEAYVDSARVRAHDYRKHLNYLTNLVMTQDDLEAMRQEVQSYSQDLQVENQLNDILLHLENPLLRALLYGQSNEAQKAGVSLKVSATPQLPEFPIREYKLVEIFQNLMDNAMDAVRTQTQDRKWIGIRLECVQEEGHTIHRMIIENPIPDGMPSIAQMTQKNFTTKEGHHQGLGLYQVSRLTARNGGELLLEDQDGIFRVEVIFRTEDK